ncbi:unnamed protein product [Rotaria sp. Silwood1]|nr:unnamed protein product [Rotaria sp. Silwood1]
MKSLKNDRYWISTVHSTLNLFAAVCEGRRSSDLNAIRVALNPFYGF